MVLFLRKIVTWLIKVFYRVKIFNKENMPEGSALVVCNHFSAIDPVFILNICSKDIYFLSKNEVANDTFTGKMLIKAGAIPVDRKNPSMESMLKCIRTLKEGKKLVLFPEGTRNKMGTNELQELKEGAGVFAVKTKTKIVPIIIEKKPRFLRRTNVVVGEPFELSAYYGVKVDDTVTEDMNADIREHMLKVQASLPELVGKKK